MGKKNRDKSKQKTTGRENKSRSANKTLFMVAGFLVLLGIVYAYSNRRGNTEPALTVPVNADTLPGIQMSEAPWRPEMNHLRDRLKIIGLPALLEEGSAMHAHQHLDLFIKGKFVSVPAMIGINVSGRFITPVHTHDTTGEVHIESPTVQSYNLGQFFDIWGVRFSSKCIGAYCEDPQNTIKVFLDGRAVAGDPRLLELKDHLEIVVTYGTSGELPNPIPSEHHFSAGS
ncbi:MAG: hypothetical protein HY204_06160 [Nitrospirae bacterium]|nr:hypothetical protein [Nitrospirota bacterium]